MCFPWSHINLEEQHLAKKMCCRPMIVPFSLTPNPVRQRVPTGSTVPVTWNHRVCRQTQFQDTARDRAAFGRYRPSPPPRTRILKSPTPRGFNEATGSEHRAHGAAPGVPHGHCVPAPRFPRPERALRSSSYSCIF